MGFYDAYIKAPSWEKRLGGVLSWPKRHRRSFSQGRFFASTCTIQPDYQLCLLNNKGLDQSANMLRLIWSFVIQTCWKGYFLTFMRVHIKHFESKQIYNNLSRCVQRWLESVCASAHSDPSLSFPPEETLDPWLPIERPSKTQIRPR